MQTQSYMDVHSSHLASTQPYTSSQPGTTDSIQQHYPHYPQPPVLHPGPSSYGPTTTSYSPYGYPNGVSSPQTTSQPVTTGLAPPITSHILPLPPAMNNANHGPHGYNSGPYTQQPHAYDSSGQVIPPGVVPRCSATLWEDEGTLCYQVEVKGVCVARRDDNHFINGTKLLNVAGMTRGRRDGILKSEKTRHVVKIGPMHLKGVWIPFERALDFANKEKITELLYPLFCHDLKRLVSSQTPGGGGIQTAMSIPPDRRRLGAPPTSRSTPVSQAPALPHPQTMPPHMSQPTTQSLSSQSTVTRPSLGRAHTFPAPPTSSSALIGVTNQGNSYDWQGPNMGTSVHGAPPPLSIDSGLSNARSMPTTPAATTPSGSSLNSMYPNQSSYDPNKSYYSATQPSQQHYMPQQSMPQPNMTSQGTGHMTHGTAGGDSHPQEPEYPKHEYVNDTNSTTYNGSRNSYTYPTNPAPSSLAGEHSQISSDMGNSGSHHHQNGTIERVPSRPSGQTQWTPSYSTSQRSGPESGNVYNVVSDARGPTTNGNVSDPYATPPSNGSYPSLKSSGKRMRDDDDREQESAHTPVQNGEPNYEYKRRKTITDTAVNGVVGASVGLQSVTTGAVPRRR